MKKTRWLSQSICLVFFLLCANTLWANLIAVTAVHATTNASGVRLVFETTGKPNYVVFSLTHPDRLVVDIKDGSLRASLSKLVLIKPYIKSVRMSKSPSQLRLVFDLQQRLHTENFVLNEANKNRYKLVVELSLKQKRGETTTRLTQLVLPLPQFKVKSLPAKNVKPVIANKAPIVPPPQPVKVPAIKPRGRDIIIVIDPGHGGKDPGATGAGGVHEKTVVLAIARYLAAYLNAQPGFEAELTRTGDYYIPLRGRLAIARRDKADMFISIHADAFVNHDAMGASVFALSERGATNEAARWLAQQENQSEFLGGATLPVHDNILRRVLIDLSQTNTISESLQIGASVLHEVGMMAVLHHNTVEQAAFVVLKSPDIPSLLVETGFITTPAQEQKLKNPQYQKKIAAAIMQGIKDYFVHNPPRGTLFADEIAERQKA